MACALNKRALSPVKQQFLELCQKVNYGSLNGLIIRNGEPVLDPAPTVLRTCRFGAENGPRAEFGKKDFALKRNVSEMFEIFAREGSCVIEKLVLRGGLPVSMVIRE